MLDEVMESMEHAILLVKPDPDGVWRIEKFSKKLLATLEVPPSLLANGKPVMNLINFCFERGDYVDAPSPEWVLAEIYGRDDMSIVRHLPSGRYVKTVVRHGQTSRIIATFTDVTDLKKRDAELAAANKVFDEVLEEMGQGLVVFSGGDISERRSTIINSRLADMMELPEHMSRLGVSHQEMLEFFEKRGDLGNESIEKLKKFRKSPNKTDFLNLVYNLPSGRSVQSVGSARQGGNGRIVTFTDISDIVQSEQERVQLAEELSHMQRLEAVGQLTGGIAHDFNNLLAVILGNAELLQMEFGSTDESLRDIHSAAKRGAELTQRLLAFSRKQSLHPTALDLRQRLEGLRRLLKLTLGETIDVFAYAQDNLWHCLADAGQVENAILNLAVNARDAMPLGGMLTIDVTNVTVDPDYAANHVEIDAGEYVQISVQDTGTGMTKDVMSNAFDPFYTTKDVGKGSGLGLSMVYGFAKQSKGSVTINSILGVGTTVSILLPRTTQQIPPAQNEPTLFKNPRCGKTILVVEDDPDVCAMVVRGLSSLGYEVRAYATGREALRKVSPDDPIDLLLTDIILPEGMSGAKLGRELLLQRPDLKILYMSGYTESTVSENDKLDVNVHLLQKPFSISALSLLVQETLEKRNISATKVPQ